MCKDLYYYLLIVCMMVQIICSTGHSHGHSYLFKKYYYSRYQVRSAATAVIMCQGQSGLEPDGCTMDGHLSVPMSLVVLKLFAS